jgi:drug/metabolite transporter (DMT)-like permease
MTVFRNLAPLVTMAVETVIMEPEHRPSMSTPILCSIGVMVIGALLFSWKDEAFSWIGVGLVLLNTFIAICDRVLQRRLLVQECKDLQSSTCMVINNSLGLVPTFILLLATHEVEGFQQHSLVWHDPGLIALVIMSAFMGLFIGVAGILCQRAMTATSFQVLQNASKVAAVFVAVHVFGDDMGSYSHKVGMFLSIGGSLAYGYVRALEIKRTAKHAKDAQDCETAENETIQNAGKTYEACKA